MEPQEEQTANDDLESTPLPGGIQKHVVTPIPMTNDTSDSARSLISTHPGTWHKACILWLYVARVLTPMRFVRHACPRVHSQRFGGFGKALGGLPDYPSVLVDVIGDRAADYFSGTQEPWMSNDPLTSESRCMDLQCASRAMHQLFFKAMDEAHPLLRRRNAAYVFTTIHRLFMSAVLPEVKESGGSFLVSLVALAKKVYSLVHGVEDQGEMYLDLREPVYLLCVSLWQEIRQLRESSECANIGCKGE